MAKGDTLSRPGNVHPLVKRVIDAKPPLANLLGFVWGGIGRGRAIAVFETGPQHANPMGTLHGGVLCDVADAAMGMAFASTLQNDESFTTINLTMNFLRPVWTAQLRAEARVVSRGKNIGYLECEIVDDSGGT